MLSKFFKKSIIFLVIIFAVIVILIGALLVNIFKSDDPSAPSDYSAVFMSSGDVYFGKLSWFPWPKLKDIWVLQRGVDPQSGQAQFGLNRFTNSFWGPVDVLYLNPREVVFWSDLRNDSQAAKAFQNPEAVGQPSVDFQGPSGPPPSQQ